MSVINSKRFRIFSKFNKCIIIYASFTFCLFILSKRYLYKKGGTKLMDIILESPGVC